MAAVQVENHTAHKHIIRIQVYQNRGLEIGRGLIGKSFFFAEFIKIAETALFFLVIGCPVYDPVLLDFRAGKIQIIRFHDVINGDVEGSVV